MAYTNAVFYMDFTNGSDAARANVGPTAYANNGSGAVRVTTGTHGLATGAIVTIAGTSSSLYADDWKITVINSTTFDLVGSTYTSNPATKGTCVPFGGDQFGVNAWKTIGSGATNARIKAGDIIRIAESPVPTSIGTGTWTGQPAVLPSSKNITSTVTSSGVVKVNCTGHGYSTGDCVYIEDHATGVNAAAYANGTWIITYVDANSFTLDGSTYPGADGGATGKATLVNRAVVKLSTAQTLTIDRTQLNWTGANDGTPSIITTDYKAGDGALKVLMDAATQTNKLQAYFATGTIAGATINGYQKLSFWFKNEVAIANAATWAIALCSDTAGANPIDIFEIPAIPSTVKWVPLTLTRSYYTLAYDQGNGTTPVVGATLTSGTATARLVSLTTTSGSWAGGDAAGTFTLVIKTGAFAAGAVTISGSDHCHVAGDMTAATGGNLGGNTSIDVKSVAIYSGATAPTNSKYVYLNNIIACTTDGLNLQSLISKNTLAQGSTSSVGYANEGWYAIKNISQDGKVIFLDQEVAALGNYGVTTRGIGYSGASEPVTTYKRETSKTTLQTTSSGTVNQFQKGGATGNFIQYQGGFNTSTLEQSGETFLDGLNGNGYGIYFSSMMYNRVDRVSAVRYSAGYYFQSGSANAIGTISCLNNNGQGMVIVGLLITIDTLININNNASQGLQIQVGGKVSIGTIYNANNNSGPGVYFNNAWDNIIKSITNANNNLTYGVNFLNGGTGNKILQGSTNYNATAGVGVGTGSKHFFKNFTINESTPVAFYSTVQKDDGGIYCEKYGGTAYNCIFALGATITTQASTLTNGSGVEWKIEINATSRTIEYPLIFPIAKVAVAANATVTVKLYMKKSHNTNIIAGLFYLGGQIAGLASDVTALKDNNTTEEEVTLTLNQPTEAGVIEVAVIAYYGGGTANVLFDRVTITQA